MKQSFWECWRPPTAPPPTAPRLDQDLACFGFIARAFLKQSFFKQWRPPTHSPTKGQKLTLKIRRTKPYPKEGARKTVRAPSRIHKVNSAYTSDKKTNTLARQEYMNIK